MTYEGLERAALERLARYFRRQLALVEAEIARRPSLPAPTHVELRPRADGGLDVRYGGAG